MLHRFSRTELLIGADALKRLSECKVAVFGVGGVGSFAVEGLVRGGIGKLVLVDDDCVCVTNINRQLIATQKTIGRPKVEVMMERVKEINPNVEVKTYKEFYGAETADVLIQDDYDYIIDAIDTISSKIDLVVRAWEKRIPIISSMGVGNKLDPTKLAIMDIYETSICPLAKVMRKELRKRNIPSLKVLCSREEPIKPVKGEFSCKTGCICSGDSPKRCTIKRQIPGSVSFVPSVAGLIIAGEVIKDLIGYYGQETN